MSTQTDSKTGLFLGNGRFQVGEKIGEGGMGVVYQALHLDLDFPIAIKFKKTGRPLEMFEREREIAAKLGHHPCMPYVVDCANDHGSWYAMELVQGKKAEEYFATARSFEDSLEKFEQLASAVEYAHSLGLVHRDIKPSNIYISNEGVVKLLDWGISEELDIIKRGGRGYTERWSAPEQIQKGKETEKVDIWGLGAMLWWMFQGTSIPQEAYQKQRSDKWLSSSQEVSLPPEIQRLVERCLEYDPLDRPSAKEVKEEIKRYREKILKRELLSWQRRLKRRSRIFLALVVFALTSAFLFSLYRYNQIWQLEDEKKRHLVELTGWAHQAGDHKQVIQWIQKYRKEKAEIDKNWLLHFLPSPLLHYFWPEDQKWTWLFAYREARAYRKLGQYEKVLQMYGSKK
ncbi:MAG: serine/threonine protein kinase, partial [Planctomycetota bacterium]